MVKGHDKKEKRIIKLKNKVMPKFQKNTGYQMPRGNSPHKFLGRLLGGIFGGRKSSPKVPASGNFAMDWQRSRAKDLGSRNINTGQLASSLGPKPFTGFVGGMPIASAIANKTSNKQNNMLRPFAGGLWGSDRRNEISRYLGMTRG